MAPSLTPGARLVAQHAAAPMAQPYSHSKAASRRHCAAGNRDLAICHTLRGWIDAAVNDSRSRCGEVPGLSASEARQPWMAHYFHGRAARLLPGYSAEQIRGQRDFSHPQVVFICPSTVGLSASGSAGTYRSGATINFGWSTGLVASARLAWIGSQ